MKRTFEVECNGFIGEKEISQTIEIEFGEFGCKICITPPGHDAEGIYIYVLNYGIMPNEIYKEFEYLMSGPKLGFYHYTDDMREGPSINHIINNISMSFKSSDIANMCSIQATCDLAYSSYDKYWRTFPEKGEFKIKLYFEIPIENVNA